MSNIERGIHSTFHSLQPFLPPFLTSIQPDNQGVLGGGLRLVQPKEETATFACACKEGGREGGREEGLIMGIMSLMMLP